MLAAEGDAVGDAAWTWGFAKSRRSPKGGGHSRSHPPQRPRLPKPWTERCREFRNSIGQSKGWNGFFRVFGSTAQRPGQRLFAVYGGSGPVAHFWCDTHRQFCARLVLHGRHLPGLHAGQSARHRRRLLGGCAAGGCAGGGAGRADRDAAAQTHLQGARAVPVAGHLCAGARNQGRRAMALGSRRTAGAARTRTVGRGADSGALLSFLRSVPDRRRAGRAGPALVTADPHTLGHVGASCDARPRDGQRAGRQPGVALHCRLCAWHHARRPGRCPAIAARASQSGNGPEHHRRGLCGRSGGRHGLDPRRLRRGPADRRNQGGLHLAGRGANCRHQLVIFKAHAGG